MCLIAILFQALCTMPTTDRRLAAHEQTKHRFYISEIEICNSASVSVVAVSYADQSSIIWSASIQGVVMAEARSFFDFHLLPMQECWTHCKVSMLIHAQTTSKGTVDATDTHVLWLRCWNCRCQSIFDMFKLGWDIKGQWGHPACPISKNCCITSGLVAPSIKALPTCHTTRLSAQCTQCCFLTFGCYIRSMHVFGI